MVSEASRSLKAAAEAKEDGLAGGLTQVANGGDTTFASLMDDFERFVELNHTFVNDFDSGVELVIDDLDSRGLGRNFITNTIVVLNGDDLNSKSIVDVIHTISEVCVAINNISDFSVSDVVIKHQALNCGNIVIVLTSSFRNLVSVHYTLINIASFSSFSGSVGVFSGLGRVLGATSVF